MNNSSLKYAVFEVNTTAIPATFDLSGELHECLNVRLPNIQRNFDLENKVINFIIYTFCRYL